jgi:hypothetical protein
MRQQDEEQSIKIMPSMGGKVLSDIEEGLNSVDEAPNDNSIQLYEDEVRQFVGNYDENEEGMDNVKDIIDDNINTLENMIGEAENLVNDTESDFAQETAAAIYIGVASLQEQLHRVAERHGQTDLVKRLKEINSKKTGP